MDEGAQAKGRVFLCFEASLSPGLGTQGWESQIEFHSLVNTCQLVSSWIMIQPLKISVPSSVNGKNDCWETEYRESKMASMASHSSRCSTKYQLFLLQNPAQRAALQGQVLQQLSPGSLHPLIQPLPPLYYFCTCFYFIFNTTCEISVYNICLPL